MKTQFPSVWQDKLSQKHFSAFTTIQEAAFDPIKNGKSLLGISPTGSGKTLA